MRLISLLSSTVAFASFVSAKLPALAQCGSADIAAIPCATGHICAALNTTYSHCISNLRSGTAAARATRRGEIEKRDGEGGQLNILNGTPFKFVLESKNSYQLNAWDLPAEIGPFSSASAYVEFKTGFLVSTGDDGGEAHYRIDGTDSNFEIQARGDGGFRLQTVFTGLSTPNNPQGSTLHLGWQHDGAVNFVLSGTDAGSFISSNAPENWMTLALPTFGDTPLGKFVLPASHDSGMSKLDGNTAGSTECNTLTQSFNVRDQLSRGARYFDIRPVISAGNYKAGHYSQISVDAIGLETAQGGNGESIDDMVNGINDFQKDKSELIILNLSHDFNTDVGNSEYRGLNQDEWNALFEKLKGINNLYVSEKEDTKLTDLPLKAFIGEHSAVVIVVESGGANLDGIRGKGFFTYDQLGPYNNYSDSDDLNSMVDDQLQKMRDHAGEYMLLSWTLTQKVPAVFLCPAAPSIRELGDKANAALFARILNESNKDAYPSSSTLTSSRAEI
ncbi:PLC-like phosphodiesterase [Auriculariales sp. MPI-PUGE-AT-0066]|nr:PLC-like phosphodiesterase [Auriculariales sp. MPI-PUGE-AT-0066]